MSKKIKFADIFQPGDILAVLVVIAGILIAVFLDGLAIKLIGVSISILGLLAMVMLISQRLSDVVESKKFNLNRNNNFKMTVVKDSSAVRQTIENFDSSGEDINSDPTMGSDEGFRIVNKSSRNVKTEEQPTPVPISEILNKDEIHANDINVETSDINSSYSENIQEINSVDELQVDDEIISNNDNDANEETENTIDESESIELENEEMQNIPAQIIDEPQISTTEKLPDLVESPAIDINVEEQTIETTEYQTEVIESVAEEVIINQDIEAEAVQNEAAQDEPTHEEPIKEEIISEEPVCSERFKKKQIDTPFSLLTDDDLGVGSEPRKEFEFFISRALLIIRSVISTRTTAFLLVNEERNQMILESYITSIPDAIVDNIKISMGNDIVSQIILSAKPEILTEINPSAELDLIPYYSTETGISSFIGIPVFYDKQVVGVIVCDTNETNAYDSATVSFLGHFSKLLAGMIRSYTEKYDLMQADKTLKALEHFSNISMRVDGDYHRIGKALVATVSDMYEAQTTGVCMYDEKREGWYITAYNSFNESSATFLNQPVDLSNSMIGDVIINSSSIMEMSLQSDKPRISPYELPLSGGYFIAVPIRSDMNTYGALFIEGSSHSALSNFDLNILETVSISAGNNVERMNLIKMLQTSSIIEHDTGLMNSTAFFTRLQEEIARVRDFKNSVSLCFIAIDKYAAFDEEEQNSKFEKINLHCISMINKNLNEYDVLGKVDNNIYSAILIGQSADKAKLWAERIRNAAAISVVEIENRRFTVTFSIGIAQISPADDIQSSIDNCSKALSLAAKKTNCVQVFY